MKSYLHLRHRFLAAMAVAVLAVGALAGSPSPLQASSGDATSISNLSPHLAVYHGPINVGIVRDGQKALLIDCGDGSVTERLKEAGISSVDQVLFTHHHRDQACGAPRLIDMGARMGVPAAERDCFDKVDDYWNNPKNRWHLYNQHPHHLMLAEPIRVDRTLNDGQSFDWGPAKIRVLSTPGHTDGSVSYLVDVDGKRIAFCGDAIYDEGQVWEIYSLQKGTVTSDYHGFLGARPQLAESLQRIKAVKPDALVPSHGRLMNEPVKAIDTLVERLAVCYDRYVAISALRHYFPKMFADHAGRPGHMPIPPGKPVPGCLRHLGTTWLLVSRDRAAMVMDCGSPQVVKKLQEMLAKGEIRRVEGLWVTHYHDDHVDAIPEFQKAFDCPCITDSHVAEVIANPLAWRLPCISPSRARVDRVTKDGESWTWHEYRLTAYHLPGQTFYHSGLLVEGEGLKMFFAGDSFTMAGIDDYCAHNRIWLGRDRGLDHCVALVDQLRPTHIFNCHVNDAFQLSPEQCRFMRANLAEREKLLGQIIPWDDPNYGIDEPWIRCDPYQQSVKAGRPATVDLAVTNHSAETHVVECRAVLPGAWRGTPASIGLSADKKSSDSASQASDWSQGSISAKTDGRVRLTLQVPGSAKAGRYVVPVDIRYAGRSLPQFTEAILVVESAD
jgi:glyoxylase-like metal-dependent hydrolase (beta-lactamase superfamily II)